MFEWLTGIFGPRQCTFEKMVQDLRRKGITRVTVESEIKAHDTTKSLAVGLIGQFDHSVLFSAVGHGMMEFRYRILIFTRVGSARGVTDETGRVDAAIRMYLHAVQYANRLREELIGIPVIFVGPYGLLDEAAYEQIDRDAGARNIVIS